MTADAEGFRRILSAVLDRRYRIPSGRKTQGPALRRAITEMRPTRFFHQNLHSTLPKTPRGRAA
jgi:hypothetical protein